MSDTLFQHIADDIIQVQLPLPFALRIVNCYLLRDGDGWAVLDTGIHTPEGEAAWRAAWAALGISPGQITQIVLTHCHPDHYGMAGWLQQQAQTAGGHLPPVRMSPTESAFAESTWRNPPANRDQFLSDYLSAAGMPADQVQPVVAGVDSTRSMTFPHPIEHDLLTDDCLRIGSREFRLIHAPGHSDGQLLFYDAVDRLLLCGDHVLIKITPNIGLWPETQPEPLRRFMESLHNLQALDVRLALPGHRALIDDWTGRVSELLGHHAARLERCVAVVKATGATGVTVHEVALGIFEFKYFTHHEWRFAMMEALAHLDYLARLGTLHRGLDDSGSWRWWVV